MHKRLMLVLAICLASLTLVGCVPLLPALTTVGAVVSNAMSVLQIIDQGSQLFFETHPDTPIEVKARYRAAYIKATRALDAAVHALEGARGLEQKDYDAAFAGFKAAYLELKSLLQRDGIAAGGRLAVGPGEALELPEPDALTYRVR